MRNHELKQRIKELKESCNILSIDTLAKYKRYLKINDITIIFSEIIDRISKDQIIIEITNKPLNHSYIQCAYDLDGYRIEWRNPQKLHLIGLSHKEFKHLKDKYECKDI